MYGFCPEAEQWRGNLGLGLLVLLMAPLFVDRFRHKWRLGLALMIGYWQGMALIILPQALKLVIPGIVNTFIALFKDTTLVLIIGQFDLLGIVQQAFADPKWPGYSVEGYLFSGLVYWAFCVGMSHYSQALERELHHGHER
ncbi:MAG: ABC transporter permease subunit [Thiohalocapsa sp.]